jgi:multiple sugar transport system ATP-binding protein
MVTEGGVSGTVKSFENLLEFGLGNLSIEDSAEPFVAQTPPDAAWRAGDAVRFTVPAERVYLFDPGSGERVR